jgi:hypothetical protein
VIAALQIMQTFSWNNHQNYIWYLTAKSSIIQPRDTNSGASSTFFERRSVQDEHWKTPEATKGVADGEKRGWKVVDAFHSLQQLRGEGCSTAWSHH